MESLANYTLSGLADRLVREQFSPVHARGLLRRYHDSAGAADFAHPSLPIPLRNHLKSDWAAMTTRINARQASADGTVKLSVACEDGACVESVLMPDFRPDRAAGCLSTQVGCAMACDFCATGVQGFSRNLSAGEIIEQYLHLKRESAQLNRRLCTIVFMGMGEPLLNLEQVVRAIHILAEDGTGHLGWRQITLSTIGLTTPLRAFVDLRLNVQLALSLHAPDDPLRQQLIPAAAHHRIADLLALAGEHQQNTGRTVVIQYCLLAGVNDSDEHAHALGELLAGRRMHVNLLMYNPTTRPHRTATDDRLDTFINILRDHRIVAHTRRSRGEDIAAACGQLTGQRRES